MIFLEFYFTPYLKKRGHFSRPPSILENRVSLPLNQQSRSRKKIVSQPDPLCGTRSLKKKQKSKKCAAESLVQFLGRPGSQEFERPIWPSWPGRADPFFLVGRLGRPSRFILTASSPTKSIEYCTVLSL